jgi:hypothetical protein
VAARASAARRLARGLDRILVLDRGDELLAVVAGALAQLVADEAT